MATATIILQPVRLVCDRLVPIADEPPISHSWTTFCRTFQRWPNFLRSLRFAKTQMLLPYSYVGWCESKKGAFLFQNEDLSNNATPLLDKDAKFAQTVRAIFLVTHSEWGGSVQEKEAVVND